MNRMVQFIVYGVLEVIWLVVLFTGIYRHKGGDPPKYLPLESYDKILRKYGPALPFIPFLIRVLLQRFFFRQKRKKGEDREETNIGPKDTFAAFQLYSVITTVRILLYAACTLINQYLEDYDITSVWNVSDHIVLGASMVTIAKVELAVLYGNYTLPCNVLPFLVSLGSLAIFGLTTYDMYFTALYFHPRLECIDAVVVGAFFQAYGAYILTS